jgi:hypothetical protein
VKGYIPLVAMWPSAQLLQDAQADRIPTPSVADHGKARTARAAIKKLAGQRKAERRRLRGRP